MSTSAVPVECTVIFRVTDLQLAVEIKELLRKHESKVQQSQVAKVDIDNGNGHAKTKTRPRSDSRQRILNILKEKQGSAPFTVAQVSTFIQGSLRVSVNTIRRSLKMGIEQGKLRASEDGQYTFLELALTPPQPAIESGK